jgi:hypothetical protein
MGHMRASFGVVVSWARGRVSPLSLGVQSCQADMHG